LLGEVGDDIPVVNPQRRVEDKIIVTRPSGLSVVAVAAVQDVVTRIASQVIIAAATIEFVVTGISGNGIRETVAINSAIAGK